MAIYAIEEEDSFWIYAVHSFKDFTGIELFIFLYYGFYEVNFSLLEFCY